MPKLNKRRILVVDDHPMLRQGLRTLFQPAKDLVICGEVDTGLKALAAVKKLKPDLAIVDISIRGGFDGLELTRRLHQRWPALPVLVFSMHEQQAYCDAAFGAGARGYCTKSEAGKNLLKAVRQILRGKSFVSKLMAF
jgi:DNA-binding NarL/FixJ family response regulator